MIEGGGGAGGAGRGKKGQRGASIILLLTLKVRVGRARAAGGAREAMGCGERRGLVPPTLQNCRRECLPLKGLKSSTTSQPISQPVSQLARQSQGSNQSPCTRSACPCAARCTPRRCRTSPCPGGARSQTRTSSRSSAGGGEEGAERRGGGEEAERRGARRRVGVRMGREEGPDLKLILRVEALRGGRKKGAETGENGAAERTGRPGINGTGDALRIGAK